MNTAGSAAQYTSYLFYLTQVNMSRGIYLPHVLSYSAHFHFHHFHHLYLIALIYQPFSVFIIYLEHYVDKKK